MGVRVVALVVAGMLVAGAVVFVAYRGWEGPSTLTASGPPTDDFEREGADGLGQVPGGAAWQADRGRWVISEGRASTLDITPELVPSLVVTGRTEADGVVAVSMNPVGEGTGLAFRYRDLENYWAIVALPSQEVWLIVAVVGGQAVFSQRVGDPYLFPLSFEPDTQVEVRLDGPWIDVFVDDVKAAALYDDRLQESTSAGLIAGGLGATDTRFDDFYALTDA